MTKILKLTSCHFDAVLFDCDGVLVDSEPITLRVMTQHLNRIGLNITYEQTIARFLGKALPEELPAIEAQIGKSAPATFIADFRHDRNLALEKDITAVHGAYDLVQLLKARGIPYAVASGADRVKMGITLGKTGLLADFEHALVGSDSVKHTKPAPDVYLKAAEILGVNPKRCLVIDDTPTGVSAGVAAGAFVLGYAAFTDPKHLLHAGARAVVSRMSDIAHLIGIHESRE
jgi:HAD superfamily hydrolase (TIGR01509 family)